MAALQDKRIVVTGASRGLGEAMAVGYAREGARLVLAARSRDDLERVRALCADAGAEVHVCVTDVAEEDQVQSLVRAAVAELGGIDVFVANAGTSYPGLTDKRYTTLDTYDADIVERVMRVNAIGMWSCMKAAIPVLDEGASFIAIGSETGRIARAGSGIYAVSKACVDVLVTIAAGEAAERGVRVNCLTPGGMVDTHLFGPDKMPEHLKQLPMGYSEPGVIVPAAVWLASDESRAVNGAQLSGRHFNATGAAQVLAELAGDTGAAGSTAVAGSV